MNKQDWSLPVFRWPALHRISPLTTSRCCVFVVSDLTKEPSQEPALCCFNLNPCKLWARRTFLIYKLSSFRHFVITVGNSHPKGILGKEETGTMSGRKREEWNNDIRKMFPHILSCQKKKKKRETLPACEICCHLPLWVGELTPRKKKMTCPALETVVAKLSLELRHCKRILFPSKHATF